MRIYSVRNHFFNQASLGRETIITAKEEGKNSRGEKGLKLTSESDDSHYCSLSSGIWQD